MTVDHDRAHAGLWQRTDATAWKRALASYGEQDATRHAAALLAHPAKAVRAVAALKGVGPASASAVLAVMAPETYPFFDELVARQVPTIGDVAWTVGYHVQYAEALRKRAAVLGQDFMPTHIERALWAHAIASGACVRAGV